MNLNRWNRIQFDGGGLTTEEERKRFEKDYEFEVCGKKLNISQSKVKGPTSVGNAIWDSSLVLSKFFEKKNRSKDHEGFFEGKRVIELGAGCGIAGITSCLLGAKVIFTDIEKILPQTKKNLEINLGPSFEYQVKELVWGKTKLEDFNPPFDFIIGADVIYHKKAVLPLLDSAFRLANENTLFYLAFESHDSDATKSLWKNIEKFFIVQKISKEELDDFFNDDGITVLLLKKNPNGSNLDADLSDRAKNLQINDERQKLNPELKEMLQNSIKRPMDDDSDSDFCEGSDFSDEDFDDDD